jgi:hypothetical protein
MDTRNVHKPYCFAGQPASCPGYFENDLLPCVCGAEGDILVALSEVAIPAVPIVERDPGQAAVPIPDCVIAS